MNTEALSKVNTFSYEKISTIICGTALDASKTIADEIAEIISTKNAAGKTTVLGLATGATPKRIYKELIEKHRNEGLSFKNVVCFNLDEYYQLKPGSNQSYSHYMAENFFKDIDIEPSNCFIPQGSIEQENIKKHCEEYDRKIEALGGLDFQLLGIGRNGHIGFNEPGSHVNSATRLITLDHITRSDAVFEFGEIGRAHV